MGVKVSKFGGSSLADGARFARVRDIVLADPDRRYVVPSAPGKRFGDDEKITDLLYACYKRARLGEPIDDLFDCVGRRYLDIASALSLSIDLAPYLDEIRVRIMGGDSPDYAASRGEYLSGLLLADYLGWPFIDAAEVIKFDRQGAFAAEWTNELMGKRLSLYERAVIPGFYGSLPDGSVRTFSRGGSDISGAVVARAASADVYENWTDVSGFLMADPRIVDNPRTIARLTYRELRELSYMGATVLHEEAVFPVRVAGIPTNIRNTFDPDHPGTTIVLEPDEKCQNGVITGIAGHKHFTLLSIEKAMMNSELGFGRRVLQALEECGVSFEHLPTGIDTMCVIVSDGELDRHRRQVIERIEESCRPDAIDITDGLALIATVGRGMVRTPGTAARLFAALAAADVNVRMIDQGSSELNIIVGVDQDDFERAVNAIYRAFT
ncbi:MAG: aspartate kinase [Clostridiales bacterium]|nr:aspartate kinase [Clostridiales bacterium]